MVKKEHIENFLRVNGLSAENSDEDIKALFRTAHWKDEDADSALLVLRGYAQDEKVEVIASRQLIHSDVRVAPEVLSSLLGVTVNVKKKEVNKELERSKKELRAFFMYFLFFGGTVAAGAFIVLGVMRFFEFSPL